MDMQVLAPVIAVGSPITITRQPNESTYNLNQRGYAAMNSFECPAFHKRFDGTTYEEYHHRIAHLELPLPDTWWVGVYTPIMETNEGVFFLKSHERFTHALFRELSRSERDDYFAAIPTLEGALDFGYYDSDAKSVAQVWSNNSSLNWTRCGVAFVSISHGPDYKIRGLQFNHIEWTRSV